MDQLAYQEEALQRPTEAEIKSSWRAIYSDPLVSSSTLKAVAVSKQDLGEVSEDGGLTLRSVYWRHYHDLIPSPTSLDQFTDTLYATRQSYARLRRRYLLAPDGRWASDCSPPLPDHLDSPGAGPSRPTSPGTKEWDPLSLESESPWKTWFAHQDLRATIRQDVDRTFPDIPYFESERVRKCMVSILFIYSILNPDVGYRQGMHELLAVCFWAIDRDSIVPDNDGLKSPLARDVMDDAMRATLDRRYVEHDAYSLFSEIMKSAKAFYEWRAEEGARSGNTTSQAPSQAPVITRCQHIHNNLIARIDPQLWERLETEGVEAQIWAIRWLRLIFTRELPFGTALRIWDGVFAEDPGLGLLDFICVAMLLFIRNELIEADYPTLLTQLLHYPAPSLTYPFDPSLILSQAIFLRSNVSPASGVEIVLQNQDLLGIKAQPPERDRSEEPERIRGQRAPRGRPSQGGQGQVQQRGVQGFAQGLIDRAQAAGLDKAVYSAVSELRRNLPDTSSAYSYLPNLPFSPLNPPTRDGQFSAIPTSSSALPNRTTQNNTYFPRPTSSPSHSTEALQGQIRDQERQMAELRLAMLGMGKAMSGFLASSDKEGLEKVKDGLLGAGGGDLDELVKKWAWHEGLERISVNGHGPRPPTPVVQEAPKSDGPTMGTLNTPRGYPSPMSSSSTIPAKPPLTLSSRNDTGPVTSLPRVPQTAPLARPHPQLGLNSNTSASNEQTERQEADPLGSLGVSQAVRNHQQQTKSASSGDPLGVGPL